MDEVRDYENEAMQQGWVGKADWKGDPDKHVDAKVFVERGEKIAGIMKSRIERLEASNRQFGEYHKKTLEQEQKRNAERVADLEGKLAQAITDGDGQAYTQIQREVNSLRSDPVPDDVREWGRISQEWANENGWYADNPKLQTYADGLAQQIDNEGFTGKARFDEITRRVKSTFPDEFTNPNKSKASAVEDSGKPASDSKAQSYDNLPPASKAACDDFVKQGFMTREDYVKTYEWED